MTESTRMWMEIIFNIAYLVVIWGLVIAMSRQQKLLELRDREVGRRFLWAFAFLALGDTGHVGFRVIAFLRGGLDANPLLVGIGALMTAYTVTIFYMLLVAVWRFRFGKPLGWFGIFLLLVGVARLVVMVFPQNEWNRVVPPYTWSLIRNSLLTVQGLGVMVLILRDSLQKHDRTFLWIGIMIALSFLFYAPVILWVAQQPLLGMLMIPKTLAYLGMAIIGYRALYLKTRKADFTGRR